MKIFVCIKQVPARDSQLRVRANSDWVEEGDLDYEINDPDAFALEEGLRLKEKHGGQVTVVSAGPARTASTIRAALAKGADRGILIEGDHFSKTESFTTARALAAAIKQEQHDLILTGLQSDDAGFGQTGVMLAETLGLPHATIVIEVEIQERSLTVKQELEGGWFQRVELPLPALLTIQSGINTVRYTTLRGIKNAKSKPVQRYTLEDLSLERSFASTIQRVYPPTKAKRTQFLKGSPKEVAAKLAEKLKFEAHAI